MDLRKISAVTAVAFSMACVGAYAQTSTWKIDPKHSSSEFQVRHLGISQVRGTITGVNGTLILDEKDITKSSVTATLEPATLHTSFDARDKDLRSPHFFDVEKFPTITFKSTSIVKSGGKLQMIGDLTLAGVTKSVTLDLDGPVPPQMVDGELVSAFSASGTVKRTDFHFGSATGPAVVSDDVKLSIDVEIHKQK
jgi:polyisoprenoid-binding protein YceI